MCGKMEGLRSRIALCYVFVIESQLLLRNYYIANLYSNKNKAFNESIH